MEENEKQTSYFETPTHKILIPEISLSLRKELECSICRDVFRDPVTLNCRHSFCRRCITTRVGNGDSTCPNCDESNKNGILEISGNPVLNALVSALNVHRHEKHGVDNQKSCHVCIEVVTNYSGQFCEICHIVFCHSCRDLLHPDTDGLANHRFRDVSGIPHSVRRTECVSHNRDFVYFCLTCRAKLCVLCHEQQHANHKGEILSVVYRNEKKELGYEVKMARSQLDECIKSLNDIRDHVSSIRGKEEQMDVTITKCFESLRSYLFLKEKSLVDRNHKLVNEIVVKHEAAMTIIEGKMSQFQQLLKVATKNIECDQNMSLLSIYKSLIDKLVKTSLNLSTVYQMNPVLPDFVDDIDLNGVIREIAKLEIQPRKETFNVPAENRNPDNTTKSFATPIKHWFTQTLDV